MAGKVKLLDQRCSTKALNPDIYASCFERLASRNILKGQKVSKEI